MIPWIVIIWWILDISGDEYTFPISNASVVAQQFFADPQRPWYLFLWGISESRPTNENALFSFGKLTNQLTPWDLYKEFAVGILVKKWVSVPTELIRPMDRSCPLPMPPSIRIRSTDGWSTRGPCPAATASRRSRRRSMPMNLVNKGFSEGVPLFICINMLVAFLWVKCVMRSSVNASVNSSVNASHG